MRGNKVLFEAGQALILTTELVQAGASRVHCGACASHQMRKPELQAKCLRKAVHKLWYHLHIQTNFLHAPNMRQKTSTPCLQKERNGWLGRRWSSVAACGSFSICNINIASIAI